MDNELFLFCLSSSSSSWSCGCVTIAIKNVRIYRGIRRVLYFFLSSGDTFLYIEIRALIYPPLPARSPDGWPRGVCLGLACRQFIYRCVLINWGGRWWPPLPPLLYPLIKLLIHQLLPLHYFLLLLLILSFLCCVLPLIDLWNSFNRPSTWALE